jgi:uncharacterized protein (TIGR02118 family)
MTTLVALWKQPADAAAFDEDYARSHVQLVQALPGLAAARTGRVVRGGYYRVAEMEFPDAEAMKAAMRSEEGKRMSEDARRLIQAFGTEVEMLTVESD